MHPPIPDLRFEQTYLRSISTHLHVSDDADWKVVSSERKGKRRAESEVEVTGSQPTVQLQVVSPQMVWIDWNGVLWVTVRDQVLSPFLQGALWGVASLFVRPFLSAVGAHIRAFFSLNLGSSGNAEGQGIGWLRGWAKGLTSVQVPAIRTQR